MIRHHIVAGQLLLLAAVPCAAQVISNTQPTPIARGMTYERNGSYAEAAAQYASVLATQPATVAALMGMEHVLPRLDRRAELLPLVHAALAADSSNVGVLAIAVRTFATAGLGDSASRYAERWSRLTSNDDEPYREWSQAALDIRDVAQAKQALDVGRARLGPSALTVERAEMLQRSGDIPGATTEWLAVVRTTPPFRDGAVGLLAQVPQPQRALVRDALLKDNSPLARQMVALLQAQWGESANALALMRGALPADTAESLPLLHRLYDAVRTRDDHASRLVTGATLELIAERQGAAARVRTLMDAARVYADADDERNARRILTTVATSPDAPSGMTSAASTTLLGVLIAEGKPAEAEKVFESLAPHLEADEHDRVARRLALAWARSGAINHAEQLIAGDSSTDGFDLRGRLRVYDGDLAGANDLLKQAGPYDDDRQLGVDRVTLLALIQSIGQDSARAFGDAMLTLVRGDSSGAVRKLVMLADSLHPAGAAETRLFAGQLALARADTAVAFELWRRADVKELPATAAAARIALARVEAAQGKTADARARLEQLIIDFPESAVVPEARRLRDALRGAIPAGGS